MKKFTIKDDPEALKWIKKQGEFVLDLQEDLDLSDDEFESFISEFATALDEDIDRTDVIGAVCERLSDTISGDLE